MRHLIRNLIIALCLLAAALLAAAGCGSQGGGEAGTETSAVTAPATARVTHITAGQEFGISTGDFFTALSDQDLEKAMADIASLGVTWIRFDIPWDLIQPAGPDSFDWSQSDRLVAAAGRHKLKMLPVLAYTPAWARPAGCKDNFRCHPDDPARFARFAGEAVRRYGPQGVKDWEIWNEPNTSSFWLPAPDAATYSRLLKEAFIAIRQADADAAVISGGLSPAENTGDQIAPRDFLIGMYEAGARDYFDALGYHPVCFPALPSDVLPWSSWSQMADLSPSIRTIMIAYDDGGKQVWATEYGVPSEGQEDVNETLEALSYRDALQQLKDKPWLATLFFHTYMDLSVSQRSTNDYFGMVRRDGTHKPAYDELKNGLAQR